MTQSPVEEMIAAPAKEMTLEEKIAAQEAMFGGAQATPVELKECTSCGRKFNEKALQSHSKICAKVFVEKRKAFDIKAARADDEIMKAQANAKHRQAAIDKKLAEMKEKAKKAWRQESAKLRNAANASKGGPMIEIEDDRVPCPKCGRKFAEETAKRHIPRCTAKPAQPVKKLLSKKTAAKKPVAKRAAKKPAAKRVPLSQRSVAKKPAVKKPEAKTPPKKQAVKKPAAKRPAKKRVGLMNRADDRVECPSCNRKFNKRSAPSHIKMCKPKDEGFPKKRVLKRNKKKKVART